MNGAVAQRSPSLDKEVIREQFNLVDFINGYVPLRPTGNGRYCGCCPFHEEKTGSFYVWATHYKCFGCGASGDLFRFVQQMEHVSFAEAIAKLTGGGQLIPLPPRRLYRPPTKPETTWQQEMARSGLQPLPNSPGAAYLERRGIPNDVARASSVRYAKSWYNKPSVIFPIRGQNGEVIAVQGRAIRGDAKMTKGPKSNGLFVTKGALERGLLVFDVAICEAPIDALSLLVLKGMPAVATCGSGLPAWLPPACRSTVWIATDADKQGDADFDAWAPLLEAQRVTVKRLRPTFKDWNEELINS